MSREHFYDAKEHPHLIKETLSIYEDSFPASQREKSSNIEKNIANGTYKMCIYLLDEEVLGFYILDIQPQLDYTLLTFLAIKAAKRGIGLGSKLSLKATELFKEELQSKYFLIEAQERQAKLYEKFGFEKIAIEYSAPSFDSEQSIPMELMKLKGSADIDKVSLSKIIEDIFTRGYSLNKNDARIEQQLSKIG